MVVIFLVFIYEFRIIVKQRHPQDVDILISDINDGIYRIWDSMMIFEENTKSLFTSDLFMQPEFNKPVLSDGLSESMIRLYRAVGIFSSENPVRETTKRLVRLDPNMVFPMHGSCIDRYMFGKYADAILKNSFAYTDILLGRKLEYNVT